MAATGEHSNEIDPEHTFTRGEAADYIVQMAKELHRLADRAELEFLAYLIEMVAVEGAAEAQREAKKIKPATPDSRDAAPGARQAPVPEA